MGKNPIRFLWMIAGFLCLILGTIGVVLPILPTVPFYMATVFCFAKGSKRLHRWFLGTRLYKKHLESFATNKEMAIGFFMMKDVLIGRLILVIVWIFHILYFGFRVGTVSETQGKEITYD